MVQFGYDSDDDGLSFEPASQKFSLHKPVCPYVCSTPSDFDVERSYLAEEIFPKIHEICHQRGTAFSPVDIQWTPDSIQTDSGHLLRINLDFISKCSPFFICILGETYGPHRAPELDKLPDSLHSLPEDANWLDKSYLVAASAGYSWILKEVHQNCSIPELEIIQAAFLTDNRHCHFYYRQPEHLDHRFQDLPAAEKEAKSALFKPENEYADLNIRDLKQRIVNKGLPVKYFQTKEELGALVLADWVQVIDDLYPPLLDEITLYETEEYREWIAHEVFSDSRRQVFINHSELRDLKVELSNFCSTVLEEPILEAEEATSHKLRGYSISSILRKQPEIVVKTKSLLVVKGDKGTGKSSLVANWVKYFTADNPEVKVISHYVGSSGRTRDINTFLRQCVTDLREEYLADDNDGSPDPETGRQNFKELCGSFQAAISLGPCVLLIDGVDELGATHGLSPQEVKSFSWIPLPLPPQCRIVVTTSKSDFSHTSLSKRPDAKCLCLSNLNTTKLKAEFLEDFMQMHFNHLNRFQIQTLLESKLSGRPLFLRILGTEMSAYSVYTDLNVYTETIREMCTSVRDLYVRCFRRWSHDHSWTYEVLSAEQTESDTVDFIGWVPDVLRLLAVSRSGLTEDEMLEILVAMGYQENVKVTQFDWLMFRLCLGDNVTESPYGIFNFSHQHLREVVEYVLLRIVKPSTAEIISKSDIEKEWKKQKTDCHEHLAKYFRKQPHGQRRSEELPWQLLMAGDMNNLRTTLTEPELFLSLYDAAGHNQSNYYDLMTYWRYLEKEGHSPVDAYMELLEKLNVLTLDHEQLESIDGSVISESEDTFDTHSETTPHIPLFTPMSPNVPRIYATPAQDHKLSVIEEASDVMSKDERSSHDDILNSTEHLDSVFITQSTARMDDGRYDLSATQVTTLTWYISQFLLQQKYTEAGETILHALNSRLMKPDPPTEDFKTYPLSEMDQLTHAKVQECLGQLYLDQSALDFAERWYKKALRTVMDMFDTEESSPVYADLQILKGKVIQQIGYLRLEEGLLDDADDLLEEALELAEVARKLPNRATVMFLIGNLRTKQCDYLMAETNLRKSLSLRQKWFGRSHPLVAEVYFSLGKLMADQDNDKGYDRISADDAFRRCLEIREYHLEKDHVLVAQVLFELGKLLKSETGYAGRTECQRVLRRALDIRITQLGGDHIETRAVRQYLNNLETTLKSAKHDPRTSERPYSSLSWRGNDLANMERRSQIHSGKSSTYGHSSRPGSQISRTGSHFSRPTSQNMSRPVSGQVDVAGSTISQKTSMSYLPASERLLLETSKPRLLNRESVERKLKSKDSVVPVSPQISPMSAEQSSPDEHKRHINVDINTSLAEERKETLMNAGVLLDSYGGDSDRSNVKFVTSPPRSAGANRVEEILGRETPPQRLYRRYGSPQSMEQNRASIDSPLGRVGEMTYRTQSGDSMVSTKREMSVKSRRPLGSARSVGSSLYTSASALSVVSTKSHKSNCDIPAGPHSIHISNARTTTMGPHSSVKSLMGDSGPKDISKGIHHKSAWYHVPGRYTTANKKYPTKRSQKRDEAKQLQKSIPPTKSDPYVAFMNSNYRKNNPRNIQAGFSGTDGHTCSRSQAYPPYPRHDKKQYVVCESCQKEAEEIMAAQEREILGIVEGSLDGVDLSPTVNGLTVPDRPRQVSYMIDEPMSQEEIDYTYPHVGTMVTFKDAVVLN